jgi:ABC-type glycerol-3-phosphate transport system substrate-binding protein
MTRGTFRAGALAALLAALAACGAQGEERKAQGNAAAAAATDEPQTVDIPQTVTAVAPGTTPMPERVAVLGCSTRETASPATSS